MSRKVNQVERDARRAAIIEAAVAVFARQGLEATSLAKIAEVIEVTHPTILNYFVSKDALFTATVLEPLEHFGGLLRPAPDETLDMLVARHVGMFMAQGSYLRLTQYILAQSERFPELAAALRAFVERLSEDLLPLLTVATGATPEVAGWRFWAYFSLLSGVALVMDDTPAVRAAMTEQARVLLGV